MKGFYSKSITLLHLIRRRNFFAALESLLALMKALGIYIHITDIFCCETEQPLVSPPPEDLLIRALDSAEISLITPLEDKDEIKLGQRLQEWGDECRGIFLRGEIAGYAWISQHKIRIPEVSYEKCLNNDEVYLYDVFIRKDRRNQGLWTFFLRDLIREVLLQGRKLVSAADLTNPRARRIKLRNGFKTIERIILIRVGDTLEKRFRRLFAPGNSSSIANPVGKRKIG